MDYEGNDAGIEVRDVTMPLAGLTVMPRLIAAAGAAFGASPGLVASDRREDVLCLARFAVMYVAWEDYHISSTRIGMRLGGRDHSTVLHGIRRARLLMVTDERFKENVKKIQNFIRGQVPLPPPISDADTPLPPQRVKGSNKKRGPKPKGQPRPAYVPAAVRPQLECDRFDEAVRAATAKLVARLRSEHPEMEVRSLARIRA